MPGVDASPAALAEAFAPAVEVAQALVMRSSLALPSRTALFGAEALTAGVPVEARLAPSPADAGHAALAPPAERIPGLEEAAATRVSTEAYALALYIRRIRDAIDPQWNPGPALRSLRRSLDARDHVDTELWLVVDEDGEVRELRVRRSSGIPALDEAALQAVRAAAPFLPPPRRFLDEGGLLGFAFGARAWMR